MKYIGRLAPTPTGYLHLGHACTFKVAELRARKFKGNLLLRIEDVDFHRCKEEFTLAALEDLNAVGIHWDYGPDKGGPHHPYYQSKRITGYRQIFDHLKAMGCIYPCTLSRKKLKELDVKKDKEGEFLVSRSLASKHYNESQIPNWRFDVSSYSNIEFVDLRLGLKKAMPCSDFGDFIVWNRDNIPAYELAVVLDDIDMGITEVVRGQDLLKSTFRQLCIYKAMGKTAPDFYHCPLILDGNGKKLAKRSHSKSIRGNEESVKNELENIRLD